MYSSLSKISGSFTAFFRPISQVILSESRLITSSPFVCGVEFDISSLAYGTPFADLYKGLCRIQDVAAKTYIALDKDQETEGTPEESLRHSDKCCQNVAVKRLRVSDQDEQNKLRAMLVKKVVVWKRLKHPNLLPFYGLGDQSLGPLLCLITLWVEQVRFLAPETYDAEGSQLRNAKRSKASDIYSFAMLAIQLYTRELPFIDDVQNFNGIPFAVRGGHRPPRPTVATCPDGDVPSDAVWELIQSCWCAKPSKRPTAKEVAARLRETLD